MKRAQKTDLFREMKKSFNRYISIMAIMALGVAFYAGVRSSEPDMQLSAKKYFDETNYMDIRVLGTLGMTEEDVKELGAVEGVALAEGGYQTELFLEAGQKDYQMSVYSLGDSINQVYVTEGRLPETSKECFADRDFMADHGYHIGDVITLRTEEETELSDILTEDTFTIVGAGTFPNYLTWQRGAVSIGTGVEDGFIFLPREAFSMEVYTVVYATVEGAKAYNPYTEEYENHIGKVAERIESIADGRCDIRYAEITNPYWEDIYEAEADIAEAEAKLADGEQEVADGERELTEAEADVAKAEQEISDGKQEIADGEAKLAEAAAEIADGEAALSDAEEELKNGEADVKAAESELEAKEKDFLAGESELLLAKEQLKSGREELENAKKALELQENELNAAKAQLEAYGMPLTPDMLAAEAELAAAKQLLAEKEAELKEGEMQLAISEAELLEGKEQLNLAKEQITSAKAELEKGRQEIAEAKAELMDGQTQYEEGLEELAKAKTELEKGQKEIEEAKLEIEEGKRELADAKEELEEGKKELAEGKLELADAKAELEKIEMPEWYILDRNTVQQFVEYGSNTERVGNLGDVFPAVFYLVAALVSLTTMTRMIEEERTQIGTMKALGYGKGAIVSKYLWYSLSATLLGGVFGVLVGSLLFPWVIMKAYGILYSNIPYILTPVQWGLALTSVLIAVVCTVMATMSSCYREMMAAPAILMRPVAPPAGRRVFLEYIKPVWNRLSFSWKATWRNLFRYKKRFFMTIFGIGGCMALLLVGFGLRDSIMEIVSKQYKEIWTYDAYLSVNDTGFSLEDTIYKDKIESRMLIQTKNMDAESEEGMFSASLFVPETLDGLESFVKLQDRLSGEIYTLTDEGVIITEKLAKLLAVSEGDTIELHFDEVTKHPVKIKQIAENYMFHYIYMSAEYYESLCKEAPEYNQLYLKTDRMSEEEKEAFSESFLALEEVDSVTYVEELQESVAVMMQSLELVVVVLIVAAGMLAFIVLYNLNNINIIERRRELATLKVLGFYDGEVGSYVYRENVLLTVLGILAGIVMGFFLHRFVILTVEIDMMMFGRDIGGASYVYSILLTCVFAVLINLSMFFKLKKIDMVESLKSAE